MKSKSSVASSGWRIFSLTVSDWPLRKTIRPAAEVRSSLPYRDADDGGFD
jgi:hypothetical protein